MTIVLNSFFYVVDRCCIYLLQVDQYFQACFLLPPLSMKLVFFLCGYEFPLNPYSAEIFCKKHFQFVIYILVSSFFASFEFLC